MKSNVEKAIENKFYCPSKFCQEIEKIVLDNEEMNYIDAVLFFCEKNNIEIESISKLITKPLKEKIKCNAIELNFMKKSSRANLPFENRLLIPKRREKIRGKNALLLFYNDAVSSIYLLSVVEKPFHERKV